MRSWSFSRTVSLIMSDALALANRKITPLWLSPGPCMARSRSITSAPATLVFALLVVVRVAD